METRRSRLARPGGAWVGRRLVVPGLRRLRSPAPWADVVWPFGPGGDGRYDVLLGYEYVEATATLAAMNCKQRRPPEDFVDFAIEYW